MWWAVRNLHKHCNRAAPLLLHCRGLLLLEGAHPPPQRASNGAPAVTAGWEVDVRRHACSPPDCWFGGARTMSTSGGRGMRSKVERRMRRETGKTMREMRRAKKLRRKLMTDEERLIYSLRRAKKKVALLLQKLKKYELPELPAPQHDPELLMSEQLQAYKKIGFRNRNYVPVGVRGVFGGVVQNMHLHWKFHETVQVCCDNFPKEKIKEMATMLARLSGGIVVNIHNVKTIIMFRGRNYRQPKNLIPINTLTKRKALFKARFEQALDSQKLNIKKTEQQLRQMGVNPEDPIAMASIQRVASTFFRAIDEKQGTPYVFHGDRKVVPEVDDAPEDPPALSSEDSDQEELDRFIAEIEDAADQEWADEEAAEREEISRIRYWNREGLSTRGARNWRGSDSEEDVEVRPRDHGSGTGSQRTTDVRKWNADDYENSGGEDWESEDEVKSAVDDFDSDVDGPDDNHLKMANFRKKNVRGELQRNLRLTSSGKFKPLDVQHDSESDNTVFGNSESELWDSDREEAHSCGTSDKNASYQSRRHQYGGNRNVMGDVKNPKNVDESWDSD